MNLNMLMVNLLNKHQQVCKELKLLQLFVIILPKVAVLDYREFSQVLKV